MIEEGKFYFIKDEYFELFKEYNLMQNKEDGTKRSCYFCFKDKDDDDIIWFVPISTKYEKYEKIYQNKKKKRSKVYNFVFGEVVGKKAVFLIQNIFPVIEKFVQEKYKSAGIDVSISETIKKKVIAYSRQVIHMEDYGIKIAFNNIKKMKKLLIRDVIMKDKVLYQKWIEKIACRRYFKVKSEVKPQVIELPEDPPDCYIKINGEYIAVEVTSCYMDNDEENDVLYKEALKEQMKSDTPLLNIYRHVGKKYVPQDSYNLRYSNKNDLIKDLKLVKEYIEVLMINKNNVWIDNTGILHNAIYKEELNFDNFLNSIENYEDTYIELKNKFKKGQVLKFYLSVNDFILKYENLKYKVGETYVFWDNDNAKLQSIRNAITKKILKYDEYLEKMRIKKLRYDKYILIIDYIRFPCTFDNYADVYEYLKKEFFNFKYNEIAILFSNNTFILYDDKYEIK